MSSSKFTYTCPLGLVNNMKCYNLRYILLTQHFLWVTQSMMKLYKAIFHSESNHTYTCPCGFRYTSIALCYLRLCSIVVYTWVDTCMALWKQLSHDERRNIWATLQSALLKNHTQTLNAIPQLVPTLSQRKPSNAANILIILETPDKSELKFYRP